MARSRKKPPTELTTEEALAQLFPKKVREVAKEEAKKATERATKKDSRG